MIASAPVLSAPTQANPQDATDDQTANDLAAGGRVLRAATAALEKLIDGLGPAFSLALDQLQAVRGRVIVTGMGKSGHIAAKIAATMASTGAPAQFVHPGEASHGDLGMITAADAVIALSKSGETVELGDLVNHTRRFGIPLVAITAGRGSALAEAADVVLFIPDLPEACPMGLAPTTSTTAMLAMGDALAVALLERRGFSAADFRLLHPGGSLGQKLRRVSDLMHGGASMPSVGEDATMAEALIEMTAKRLGCVGVLTSEGALAGIITDGDLRRHMSPDLLRHGVGDLMTRTPVTIKPSALLVEALALMNERAITKLFVVEQGRAVGVLDVHDCLRVGVQ
jgi:arabinose-5-phosphate isomerase